MRGIDRILKESKTVAVVGLSPRPERDSHRVAMNLKEWGYRVIPVNPAVQEVLGEKSYPDLVSIPEKVDIVDIFRRSEEAGPIVDEAIAIKAKVVWMQDGVIDEAAAARARKAGLDVVMNDCIARQHARLSKQGKL